MQIKKLFSFKRFLSIAKKEFIQVKRDPVSLRIPIIMPLVWMFLLSYAISTDVDKLSTIVFDQSKTAESQEYVEKFVASNYFVVKEYVSSEKEISDSIDKGVAKVGLIIPPDFSKNIKNNKPLQSQLIIDGTEPITARAALSCGVMVSDVYLRDKTQNTLKKIGISQSNMTISTRVWYNPNMESKLFIIPGLIGLVLQNITTFLTAFALVKERERGTIEQLIVTPIKPTELILGKLVPYIIIGFADLILLTCIAVLWFHIHIMGSIFLLIISGLIFVICSLSLGMLLSTFSKNQTQALLLSVIVLLPSVLMSGFMFPREAMPQVICWISNIIPLTYFLNITRGVVLKGIGITLIWNDIIALCVFTLVILCIASLRFKKYLD